MAKAKSEPKTAWGKHVRSYMDANPGVSYKDALIQAKASYQSSKSKPVKVSKPAKVTKPKAAPKAAVKAKVTPKLKAIPKPKEEKKESKATRLEPWKEHVAEYREQNPGISLKEVLKAAKLTYGEPEKKIEEKKHDNVEMEEHDEKREEPVSGSGKDVNMVEMPVAKAPKCDIVPAVWSRAKRAQPLCGCGRRKCNCIASVCNGCEYC